MTATGRPSSAAQRSASSSSASVRGRASQPRRPAGAERREPRERDVALDVHVAPAPRGSPARLDRRRRRRRSATMSPGRARAREQPRAGLELRRPADRKPGRASAAASTTSFPVTPSTGSSRAAVDLGHVGGVRGGERAAELARRGDACASRGAAGRGRALAARRARARPRRRPRSRPGGGRSRRRPRRRRPRRAARAPPRAAEPGQRAARVLARHARELERRERRGRVAPVVLAGQRERAVERLELPAAHGRRRLRQPALELLAPRRATRTSCGGRGRRS